MLLKGSIEVGNGVPSLFLSSVSLLSRHRQVKRSASKNHSSRQEVSITGRTNVFLTVWILSLLSSKSPYDTGHEIILRKNWCASPGFGGIYEEKDWYTLLSGKSEKRMLSLVNLMTKWREKTVQEAGSSIALCGVGRHEFPWVLRMPLWVSRFDLDLWTGEQNYEKSGKRPAKEHGLLCMSLHKLMND